MNIGDLETLLAQAESIKQKKRRENLIEFAEQARISKELVFLKRDVPLPLGLDALASAAIWKDPSWSPSSRPWNSPRSPAALPKPQRAEAAEVEPTSLEVRRLGSGRPCQRQHG